MKTLACARAMPILAVLSALSAQAATLTFQEGVNGYTGAVDTFVSQNSPSGSFGASTVVEWDADDPPGSGSENIGLLRFDNIFGTNGAQIPPGSQITFAVLQYTVNNGGDDGRLHDALVDWGASTTYNGFGGDAGVQADEHGPLVNVLGGATVTHTVEVTSSVTQWADDPNSNHGWVILPTGTDGVEFRSSEYASNITQRPRLRVVIDEGPPAISLVRGPYLQMLSSNSVTIAWRTNLATDSRVTIGTDLNSQGLEVTDAQSVIDHAVEVTGLLPDMTYFYGVGDSSQIVSGPAAGQFFRTAPAVASPKAFSAWVLGDSGTGQTPQFDVRDAMLAETAADPPDLMIHLGDMAYETGTDAEFTSRFFAPYQAILRNTVCWPTIGNHEASSSDSPTQSGPYYSGYILPTAGQSGGLASGTEAYYSFDYANVHFVCLDSHDTPRNVGSAMLNWLTADIAATDRPWLVAFWHHPPYSKGSHDSDDVADSGGRMRDMRENVLPILEAGGVDLVLAGHSHAYERSFLVDGAYDTPTTAAGHILDGGDGRVSGDGAYLKAGGFAANDGAIYVVAGHGGRPVAGTGGHPLMYFTEIDFGSCILDVDRNVLSMRNVRHDGVISDTFTVVKGAFTGDCDADGDVDSADADVMIECTAGPAGAWLSAGCLCADLNQDDAVDLLDFWRIQRDLSP